MTDAEKKAAEEAGQAIQTKAVSAAETKAKEVAETAVAEVKTAVDNVATDIKKLAEQQDAIATEQKRAKMAGSASEAGVNPLQKALEDNADKLKNFTGNREAVVIQDVKATITNASITANGAFGVIAPTRLPGVVTQPDRPEHVRDFIATGTMTGDQMVYVRESGYTNGAAITAEGGLKPNSDLQLETKSAPARKIATHFKISEEMLADIPALLSYLQARATQKVMLVEDAQLMYGSGTGTNINGIYTQATAFTGGGLTVANATNVDVLRAAISQIRQGEYAATAIMMNPEDVAAMELEKGTDGHYVLPALLTGQETQIKRVPIIENSIMAAGQFLVGDFRLGAQVFYREGINIRIYDQNEDDAIKNLVTIVIEERLALCVYRPEAFVKGTFATAKTALAA